MVTRYSGWLLWSGMQQCSKWEADGPSLRNPSSPTSVADSTAYPASDKPSPLDRIATPSVVALCTYTNMAEFGKRARELVKEMLNYEPDALPAYNEELIRQSLREVEMHNTELERLLQIQEERNNQTQQATEDGTLSTQQQQDADDARNADAVATIVHYEAIARIKRLLMCYMLQRLDRLKNMRWEHRQLPSHIEPCCSQQEAEAFKAYDKLLNKFMSKHQGIGHDLTLDCDPPRDNTVTVLVTKNAGAHMFSFGRLSLIEGALMRLPVDEAEPFIKAGVLQLHDRTEFL